MAVTCTVVTSAKHDWTEDIPSTAKIAWIAYWGHVVRATPLFAVVPHTKNCQQAQEGRSRQNFKRSEPGN